MNACASCGRNGDLIMFAFGLLAFAVTGMIVLAAREAQPFLCFMWASARRWLASD